VRKVASKIARSSSSVKALPSALARA